MNNSPADAIIQACKENRSKRLDLGQCGLLGVPAEVWEMGWLEELILGNNPEEKSNYDVFKADPAVYEILFGHGEAVPNSGNTELPAGKVEQALNFTCNRFGHNNFRKEAFNGLRKLQKLRYLNLNKCGLAIIDFIFLMRTIDILLIGGNPGMHFSSVPGDMAPVKVRVLDLFGSASRGSEKLFEQINQAVDRNHLQILDFSYNNDAINGSQYNYILNFNNLLSIDISYTLAPDLGRLLLECTRLKFIRAENCSLGNVPCELLFSRLEYLNLNGNRLGLINLPDGKDDYPVKELWLENNALLDVHFISRLTGIERLFLSGNKLTSLAGLEELKNLKVLRFEDNQVNDLSFVSGLKSLDTLLASGNQFTDLTPLLPLTTLHTLSLSENKLADSGQLQTLLFTSHHLKSLHLYNNQFKDIPNETLGRGRLSDCLVELKEYFNHVRKGQMVNNEIKLILVGNSTAGKTTLRKQLLGKDYNAKEDTTHGIVMETLVLRNDSLKEFTEINELQVQVWDFGGQEYYHETHKLFFSDNAVYIVVWEEKTNKHEVSLTEINETGTDGKQVVVRKYIEHHTCEYWLKNIRHYAPSCPVLVVQNKIDLYLETPLPVVETTGTLPPLKPVRIGRINDDILDRYNVFQAFDLSLKKFSENDPYYVLDYTKFFRQLSKVIARTVQEFTLGISYFEIKKLIQSRKDEHMWDYETYRKVCENVDPDIGAGIQQLSKYLSNTSVILYYPDHQELSKTVFVNPIWVSDTIYSILDNNVLNRNGEFERQHVISKFNNDQLATDFIELMERFELIFPVDQNSKDKNPPDSNDPVEVVPKNRFVAPQYLPENSPNRAYTIYRNLCCEPKLIVHFPDFLPKTFMNGILSRFASTSIDKSYYRYGVAFETTWITDKTDQNINLIECDFERSRVSIYSKSNDPYNLREIFESILMVYTGFRATRVFNTGSVAITTTILDVVATNKIQVHISIDGENFVSWNELHERFYNTSPDALPLLDDTIVMATKGDPLIASLFSTYYNHKGEVLSLAMMPSVNQQPPKLFISYSHKDETYKDELLEHLSGMRRNGEIKDWTDRAIIPGERWDELIKKRLEEADIVIFLVSSSFMASDYIQNIEIKKSIERYNKGNLVIIPIPVRPFDYHSLPLKDIQSASKDFKPINGFVSRDEGWSQVVTNLRLSIAKWKAGKPGMAS